MNEVREVVYEADSLDAGFIPASMDAAIAWMQDKLEKIPLEYRGRAKMSFDTYEEYGCAYLRMSITYVRPKTPGEEDADAKAHINFRRKAQAREVAQLCTLIDRYGLWNANAETYAELERLHKSWTKAGKPQ